MDSICKMKKASQSMRASVMKLTRICTDVITSGYLGEEIDEEQLAKDALGEALSSIKNSLDYMDAYNETMLNLSSKLDDTMDRIKDIQKQMIKQTI